MFGNEIMDETLLTLEDLKLKWVTKNSGQVHYCQDENGRILAKIHESFNDLCSISVMENNNAWHHNRLTQTTFEQALVELNN